MGIKIPKYRKRPDRDAGFVDYQGKQSTSLDAMTHPNPEPRIAAGFANSWRARHHSSGRALTHA